MSGVPVPYFQTVSRTRLYGFDIAFWLLLYLFHGFGFGLGFGFGFSMTTGASLAVRGSAQVPVLALPPAPVAVNGLWRFEISRRNHRDRNRLAGAGSSIT